MADTANDRSILVQGAVVFESPGPRLADATIRVILEDTSMVDALAHPICEEVIRHVSHNAWEAPRIPFTLRGDPKSLARGSFSIRAHVSTSGDCGPIRTEDYVTMQHIPVRAFEPERQVEVLVRRVGR